MNKSGAPSSLWLFCAQWLSSIHNITSKEQLKYRTPYEIRHGDTPDISPYLQFTFYEPVLYLDNQQTFPCSKELPGHFLGVASTSGDALTYTILSDNGEPLVRSMIRSQTGKKPQFGFPNQRVDFPDWYTPDATQIPPPPNPTVQTF